MMIIIFSYAGYVLQKVFYQAWLFRRANLGSEGSHEAELVWDQQKEKEQSFPSPQDCHKGLFIVDLSVGFSQRERQRDC